MMRPKETKRVVSNKRVLNRSVRFLRGKGNQGKIVQGGRLRLRNYLMRELTLHNHNNTKLLSYSSTSMHGGKSEQTATFPQTERSFHLALDCFRTSRTASQPSPKKIPGV